MQGGRSTWWITGLAGGLGLILLFTWLRPGGMARPALQVRFAGFIQPAGRPWSARLVISNQSPDLVLRLGTYGLSNRPAPPPGEFLGDVNGYAYLRPGQAEEMVVPVVAGEGDWRLQVGCHRETWRRRWGQWLMARRSAWGLGAVVRRIPLRHLGVVPEFIESDPVPASPGEATAGPQPGMTDRRGEPRP